MKIYLLLTFVLFSNEFTSSKMTQILCTGASLSRSNVAETLKVCVRFLNKLTKLTILSRFLPYITCLSGSLLGFFLNIQKCRYRKNE